MTENTMRDQAFIDLVSSKEFKEAVREGAAYRQIFNAAWQAAIAHQNQEAVAIIGRWSDIKWLTKQSDLAYGTKLYLAPPQSQDVNSALEEAAKVCEEWIKTSNFYGFTGDAEQFAMIQSQIRALIK